MFEDKTWVSMKHPNKVIRTEMSNLRRQFPHKKWCLRKSVQEESREHKTRDPENRDQVEQKVQADKWAL
jgi:hypothetical protein